MATLTYVYADSTAVLGPLATFAEPHSYDLCADHAARLTVPRGWEVLRLALPAAPPLSPDDLLALAEAVREDTVADPAAEPSGPSTEGDRAGSGDRTPRPPLEAPHGADTASAVARRHLRLLREPS